MPLAGHTTVSGYGSDGLPKVAIKRTSVEKFSWKEKGKEIYYDSSKLLRIPELGNIQIRVDSVTRVTGP